MRSSWNDLLEKCGIRNTTRPEPNQFRHTPRRIRTGRRGTSSTDTSRTCCKESAPESLATPPAACTASRSMVTPADAANGDSPRGSHWHRQDPGRVSAGHPASEAHAAAGHFAAGHAPQPVISAATAAVQPAQASPATHAAPVTQPSQTPPSPQAVQRLAVTTWAASSAQSANQRSNRDHECSTGFDSRTGWRCTVLPVVGVSRQWDTATHTGILSPDGHRGHEPSSPWAGGAVTSRAINRPRWAAWRCATRARRRGPGAPARSAARSTAGCPARAARRRGSPRAASARSDGA